MSSCQLVGGAVVRWLSFNPLGVVVSLLPHTFPLYQGHPWVLFYTETTTAAQAFSQKLKNNFRLTSKQPTPIAEFESERDKVLTCSSHSGVYSSILSSSTSDKRLEEKDHALVDVLAAAISRVRISEPKRSRLCSPASPIQQECSSKIKVNSLCAAF